MLTTKDKKENFPTHVQIEATGYMSKDSTIMLEQLRTIDKSRLKEYATAVDAGNMSEVDEALKISLALNTEAICEEKEEHMNELQVFNSNEFGDVRTVIENGEPMFCLADVCKALDISNVGNVKNGLNEKGIRTVDTLTNGGMQKLLYINEANLYKTIFQSRKESAERFTDWVTGEVLPALRKTGEYKMKPMSIPEQIQLLAQGNVELEKKVDAVNNRINTLEQDMPLYGCEIDEVKGHVNRKGVNVLGGKQSEAYRDASIRGSVYSDIYGQLKREYGAVTSYKSIKRKYLPDVHEFIDCYAPPTVLAEQINDANAQMNFGG